MAWTDLTYAFGSLLTSTKMTQLFDNITAAFNKDGGAPVLANGYVVNAMIGASSVAQSELKTAQGSVSATTAINLLLPGGEYGFYPQFNSDVDRLISGILVSSYNSANNWHSIINLTSSTGGSVFARQRYFQASPPYMIGSREWGHFLYLLRRISDGIVISSYEAEDPPHAYNGLTHLPKDHVDRISATPHPFADYWDKDPVVDGLEIVLVDLSTTNTKKWISDNRKVSKGILEDIRTVLAGKGTAKAFSDYDIPVIPNFTDRVKIITP